MKAMIILREELKEIELVGEVYLEDLLDFINNYFLDKDGLEEFKIISNYENVSNN